MDFDSIKAFGAWVLTGVLTLIAWVSRRQIARIDALEHTAVRRDEIDKLGNKLESGLSGVHNRLDDIYKFLAEKK